MAEEPTQVDVLLSFHPSERVFARDLGAGLTRLGFKVAERRDPKQLPPTFAALVAILGKAGLGPVYEADRAAAQGTGATILRVVLPGGRWSVPNDAVGVDLRKVKDSREAVERVAAVLRDPAAEASSLRLSPSVASLGGKLSGEVAAAEIVAHLWSTHTYGKERSVWVPSPAAEDSRADVGTWLRQVASLFERERVPQLHGRLVIVGLGMLDSGLRQRSPELFDDVADEVTPPLETLLTEQGRSFWWRRQPPETKKEEREPEEDTVPTHTDNPATVDALRREGFARVLAGRIRAMRAQEVAAAAGTDFPEGRAFLVHLDGPWGSGKTSLLNFLGDALRNPREGEGDPWVVVTFNAWQHQRIVPPWWWLMSTVAHQGARAVSRISPWRGLRFRARETLWRASPALPWLILPLAFGAVVAVLWVSGVLGSLGKTGDWLGAVGTAISVLTALIAIVRAVASRTAQGARAYMQQTRDPMQAAKAHFADLVRWLHYPVAVFVDDLDRCKGGTVVELLEGMQTLFRDVPVTYVVAADGNWLSESYARDYDAFAKTLSGEPGRPFGYVFLEKTFQMTFTVPAVAPETLAEFWDGLIRRDGRVAKETLDEERDEARKVFERFTDEASIREELSRNPGTTAEQKQARAEEAAIQLAAPKYERATEHALRPFIALLGGNPRALKRLVNAYGVARDVEILNRQNLEGSQENQHRTALWALLNLRWPRLGDYLAEHPDAVSYVGSSKTPPGGADGLETLFSDDRVVAVVEGRAEGVHAKLDASAIRRCTGQE